jgi:hypothetical protein
MSPFLRKAAIGELASTDQPDSPFIRENAGQRDETVEAITQFKEFVRLQVGNSPAAGYRNWYIISAPLEWQTIKRFKRWPSLWIDNGTEQKKGNDGW